MLTGDPGLAELHAHELAGGQVEAERASTTGVGRRVDLEARQ